MAAGATSPAGRSEPEQALYLAWTDLNGELDRPTFPLRLQQRITACVRDVLCTSAFCRELGSKVVADLESVPRPEGPLSARSSEVFLETYLARGDAQAADAALQAFRIEHVDGLRAEQQAFLEAWESFDRGGLFLRSERFATLVKSFYFFARALQDAGYCALLELRGEKWSTPKTSMSKGINNSVGDALEAHAPGYREWFLNFREIRNSLKYGATTASTCTATDPRLAEVILHTVVETPRSIEHRGRVSHNDVDVALSRSTSLLTFVTSLAVASRGAPR